MTNNANKEFGHPQTDVDDVETCLLIAMENIGVIIVSRANVGKTCGATNQNYSNVALTVKLIHFNNIHLVVLWFINIL